MSVLSLLVLFGLSSAIVAAIAIRGSRQVQPSLGTTARAIVDFAGLWAGCLVLNLVLGVVAILGVRLVAGVFVSIYILNDVSVVILAAFQAVAALAWMGAAEPRAGGARSDHHGPSGVS